MRGELLARVEAYLATHRVGVLSLAGTEGPWAIPVRYLSRGLTIACVLPGWAEIGFRLESGPEALLVVPDPADADRRWLTCRGRARLGTAADWPDLLPAVAAPLDPTMLYQLAVLAPSRIDLIDERAGWGRSENLDL